MQLLLRPPIAEDEGLRAYVCRLATRNSSPTFFRPMLDSMSTVTRAVPALVDLTGASRDVLLRRGSVVMPEGRQAGGVRFGDVVLPRKAVRGRGRSLCPKCIADGEPSRCVWDLRRYDVCDRHGLRLVYACSSCKRPLSWLAASADRCGCGFPFAELQAQTGGRGRRELSKVLASSMLRTIHGGPVMGDPGSAVAIPIDWTLVLCEFIAEVVIPVFGERYGLTDSRRFHAVRDELIAGMLGDRIYRDYLRDLVFMHATSDPMTLVATLRPGRSKEWVESRYEGHWTEVSFHQSLWDFMRVHGRSGVSRKLKPDSWVMRRRSDKLHEVDTTARDEAVNPVVQQAVTLLSAIQQKVPVVRARPAESDDAAVSAVLS